MPEAIRKLIHDPGWWVTAVFVGLIVSVIAGFMKDAISRALSASSDTFRQWRERKRIAFTREAEETSRDFGFILYTRLKAIGMMILWTTMLTMMVAAYILLKVSETHRSQATALLLGSGLLSFFPYFRAIYYMRVSYAAKKLYTERHFPEPPAI